MSDFHEIQATIITALGSPSPSAACYFFLDRLPKWGFDRSELNYRSLQLGFLYATPPLSCFGMKDCIAKRI